MRIFITILFLWSLSAYGQFSGGVVGKRQMVRNPVVTRDTVQVNLWDSVSNIGKITTTGWNDVNIPTNAGGVNYSYNLLYASGAQSGISFAWRQNDKTTRALTAYNDNGGSYGTGQTTNFPTASFRSSAYANNFDNSYIMIQGLNNAKYYDIEILSSRSTATNYTTEWSYGGTTVQGFPRNNITTLVTISNMVPVSGRIDIMIHYVAGGNFAFLQGYRLIEKNSP